MNEFIEQFLVECRELVEQATDDLLALEETPGAQEPLDGAFRGFHTLKGAAGIVEFAAMGRALHAAEDMLAAARAGDVAVTPALISDALTCLDQVVQWLDEMQAKGGLPADADLQADALVKRLTRGDASTPSAEGRDAAWAQELAARHPDAARKARTALRFRPDPDSFFAGIDPLARLETIDGLIVLEAAPPEPWPALAALDPFRCSLGFLALAAETPEDLRARLGDIVAHVDLEPLQVAQSGDTPLSEMMLQAQLAMLAEPSPDGAAGRVSSAVRVAANVLRQTGHLNDAAAMERLGTGLAAEAASAIERVLRGERPVQASDAEPHAVLAPEPAMRGLRVDVERIDALVKLTGELTVATNALAYAAKLALGGADAGELAGLLRGQHAQLDRLVGDLQHSVLAIRVLPVRHVFQRFPRLVREMVVSLGKPARLVAEGEGTEADKAIVEALFEPLLHVVRNALDHGVETAAERAAAGKPPSATIILRARREGQQVVVEVEDDGGGVDLERVRAVALARKVASEEALAGMGEAELVELIFAPGFSTAAQVTNVSGRGVGMDAVRAAVTRLGGRVSVASRRGQGTLVQFILPFSVVMSRVMTVEAGGQVFGIPLEAVVETVKVPRAAVRCVGAAQAVVLRNRTVPLLDLAAVLGQSGAPEQPAELNVVIASVAGELGGLAVDRFGERMDVMLKPLEGLLAETPAIAGTTLLGDGRVLLVLNIEELMK